jgi:hypothetical protein
MIPDAPKPNSPINAIIKKLIREEHMLMVVEDSNDLTKKILQIHPNYVMNE